MKFEDFWYIVAESKDLRSQQCLARTVLDEWLVIFRDKNGKAVALRDRCLHRNSRLSPGYVRDGCLHCPYHGWVYDATGQVVAIPSQGYQPPKPDRAAQRYATCEQDGYIYVRLNHQASEEFSPFAMPNYQRSGWETIRVTHDFQNNVTNCAENFIDIPHTVSVHPGIFRTARQQKITMTIHRKAGEVWADYDDETTNLGWFRHFLNPQGHPIRHCDRFIFPNITHVHYDFGPHRQLFITSQSIPQSDRTTRVYTDVTFNYGLWNKLARPFVRWTAKRIIGQDVTILNIQGETIAQYGTQFCHTPADTIHVFVESIRSAIARGEDPRTLPPQSATVEFWV